MKMQPQQAPVLAAQELIQDAAPKAYDSNNNIFGQGVVPVSGVKVSPKKNYSPITATMANASGSDKVFALFDPTGMLAAAVGGTVNDPDSIGNGLSVAAVKSRFNTLRLSIDSINYQVTSSAQFNKAFKYVENDADFNSNIQPIDLAMAQRNTQQVATILTVKFPQPLILSSTRGFVITVADGQTVNLTFNIIASF